MNLLRQLRVEQRRHAERARVLAARNRTRDRDVIRGAPAEGEAPRDCANAGEDERARRRCWLREIRDERLESATRAEQCRRRGQRRPRKRIESGVVGHAEKEANDGPEVKEVGALLVTDVPREARALDAEEDDEGECELSS